MLNRRLALFISAGLTLALAAVSPAPVARASADDCDPGMKSDFNGDGWTDAVVGDPQATVSGLAAAGRIVVLYGDADGRVGEGTRDVLWQGEENVAGVAEAGDQFGYALAVGDLDCDGFTDVVVGVPYEDINGQADSGYVQVVWGGPGGLGISQVSTQYTQVNFGQSINAGDQFGYALDVVEDLGQGGTPAPDANLIAIGVPGASVGGDASAGALAVVVALDGGSDRLWITQDSDGVVGAAEPGDRFGHAVACGYLSSPSNVTTTVDCAVGAPYEDIGTKADAGSVTVIEEIYDGEDLTSVALDQDAAGVPGSAEAGDHYGMTVEAVRVGSTSWLAVGAPDENLGSVSNAGLVQLFSSDRKDIDPETALTQDTAGVADSGQTSDRFGASLAWIAPGLDDTRTRLAVGIPGEDISGNEKAGMVQVFAMGYLSSEKTHTQDSIDLGFGLDDQEHFGASVATVAGADERVLLIGVPDDVTYATGMVAVVPFSAGAERSWRPGFGGVPSAGGEHFGQSLGGTSGGTT